MKKLTWWMRLVGSFYTLLTLMNLYGLFINADLGDAFVGIWSRG